MSNSASWSTNIGTENSGAGDIRYYVDTAEKNTSRIAEYIKNQLKEDQLAEQLTLPINGPFTGGK